MASRKEARSTATHDFCVGPWLAQPALNLIRDRTVTRHLEPQVMDLLVFLSNTGGRVVSKDELINAVWDGRFIADTTLTRAVADLRRALGDDQRAPQYIETIPKRGYRLVAAVSANGARPETSVPHSDAAVASHGSSCIRIADRLATERRRRFVGRDNEIAVFHSALLADEPPFVVLHVSGPGGVGKTTLLEEFARVAQEAGRLVVRIDGRNIESTPLGFIVALSRALGSDRCELPTVVERWPAGGVLFVDTYELLTSLDDWLRDTLLPQLPARSVIVIAGRHEPATTWRANVDWAALTRVHPLGNLGPAESRTFLDRCGVAVEHHDDALAFTRGHPLALSLSADVLTRGDRLAPSRLETEPEVVRLLIEKFVQEVPSREHRLALHVCVSAHATTEPLLAAALDRTDVHDLFEWLGHLSFVESGPLGLFPHDLARDVVYMDFRWRDPDAAFRVTERLIAYLYGRLDRTRGLERLRVWFDLIYLQRYNARLRPYMEWVGFGTTYVDVATANDHSAILEMIEKHEGRESAAIARYWLARQPEAFLIARSMTGEMIGMGAHLRLEAVTPEDLAADPAVAHAVVHAERYGPPNPGEHITYCRFFMHRERYQAQVLASVAATASQSWTVPRLAWCFIAAADPDVIEPLFTELHIWRTRGADFEVGGRRYGVFAHDWRIENAEQWLRLKAERAWRLEGALPTVQSQLA
ncbi:MAG TPA: winged helix-turn-helix domain-containing protein [Vicinamibacterales bacterium]|nr:winged helix-turn-helix domain-containing protein [Vicinamibacterales bacterium]